MIPKAAILTTAQQESLQHTTVEKDYVLKWILYGISNHPVLSRWVFEAVSREPDEVLIPREHFPSRVAATSERGASSVIEGNTIDRIRFAARNRLLVEVTYDGVTRVVEPYSMWIKGTRNRLLYMWEITRGNSKTEQIKAYRIDKIQSARILQQSFTPRYAVEL
jgi:hypothetical protein